MHRYALTLACAALLAGAPSLQAQVAQKPAETHKMAQHKMVQHNMAGMSHDKMAAEHKAMMASQAVAIRDAQAVERGARAHKMDLALLRRDAARAQDALQANIKRLDEVEKSASAQDKEHMAPVRTHEEEALKHANELVDELKKNDPSAAAVEAHAKAVTEHAQAANAARDAAHKTAMGTTHKSEMAEHKAAKK